MLDKASCDFKENIITDWSLGLLYILTLEVDFLSTKELDEFTKLSDLFASYNYFKYSYIYYLLYHYIQGTYIINPWSDECV